MSDIALLIAIIVAQAIFGFIFLKLAPTAIMKFAETEIERRSDIKLEKVKGDIQGSYATLKSSVDMLTASNTGLHPHIIDAVGATRRRSANRALAASRHSTGTARAVSPLRVGCP